MVERGPFARLPFCEVAWLSRSCLRCRAKCLHHIGREQLRPGNRVVEILRGRERHLDRSRPAEAGADHSQVDPRIVILLPGSCGSFPELAERKRFVARCDAGTEVDLLCQPFGQARLIEIPADAGADTEEVVGERRAQEGDDAENHGRHPPERGEHDHSDDDERPAGADPDDHANRENDDSGQYAQEPGAAEVREQRTDECSSLRTYALDVHARFGVARDCHQQVEKRLGLRLGHKQLFEIEDVRQRIEMSKAPRFRASPVFGGGPERCTNRASGCSAQPPQLPRLGELGDRPRVHHPGGDAALHDDVALLFRQLLPVELCFPRRHGPHSLR